MHKVSSKQIAGMFQARSGSLSGKRGIRADRFALNCEAAHVDGSMNASEKGNQSWIGSKLKLPENTCRILSNVRCLSEGVDVPALDAVLFLTPRNSQVDVVQSVGRVMRTRDGQEKARLRHPAGGDSGRRGTARSAERQPDLQSGVASVASAALAR
jgi:predicted helicase